jgi:hypothetical protein
VEPKSRGLSIGDTKALAEPIELIGGAESSSGREQARLMREPVAAADPCKRGRRILGISGRKAAKQFRKRWRATFTAAKAAGGE